MLNKKGQALVEFVLILPIVVFILLAMFDFGSIIYHKNRLENVLANVVSLYEENYSEDDIKSKLLLNKEGITLAIENNGAGEKIITLKKECDVITPGLNFVLNSPYEIYTSRSLLNE